MTRPLRFLRAAIGSLIALSSLVVCTSPASADDPAFDELVKKSQAEKPQFAERHKKLLAERYDLADRPAEGSRCRAASRCRRVCACCCRKG